MRDIMQKIINFIKSNYKSIIAIAAIVVLGSALIVSSVVMITSRSNKPEAPEAPEETIKGDENNTKDPNDDSTENPEDPDNGNTEKPEDPDSGNTEKPVDPDSGSTEKPEDPNNGSTNQEGSALEGILEPSPIILLRPVASGVLVKENDHAIIDYSNTRDGYVMVRFKEETSVKLKVQVKGPTTTYTYNITPLEWTVFPISDGNGTYQVKVLRNTTGNKYSTALSVTFEVKLDNEFAPFLRPNQYVNYENATATMNKAAQLVAGKKDLLAKVEAVYSFVINNISYDYEEAATVQSGYLPVLDEVLETKKGICFDFAALMTGMLRSQNIPCKLVVGYADDAYHAWINVWSPDKGWIDGAIFFDGVKWQVMDPTYASTGGSSSIKDVTYTSKYIY